MSELYPKIYLSDVQKYQGNLFDLVQSEHPEDNLDDFTRAYFLSPSYIELTNGHPHYMTMCGIEHFNTFIEETGYTFKPGIGYLNCTRFRWCGEFYARYQWKRGLTSEQLLKEIPPLAVARMYPTFHTFEMYRAVEEAIEIYGVEH